uniref:RUN and FYVE domain-containing protein 2-like isoform X2 n=1 Tax=Styela clava TaxID=7725 RepID=UPI00193953F8|nr:RUN and FYVE domain-containing protein 2-like isoform X2 [Styela clava]
MADAEYIEITSSEISAAKKDLDEPEKVASDATSSDDTSQDIEIIENVPSENNDSSNGSNNITAESETIVTPGNNVISSSQPDSMAYIESNEIATEKVGEENETEKDEQDIGQENKVFPEESNAIKDVNVTHNEPEVQPAGDAETFEVIHGVEEQTKENEEEKKADENKENEPTETIPEDKPTSPFHRFRSFKRQEKKDQAPQGSSITLPSIFSDISTSFMSLKNIAKRKDLNLDDTHLHNMNDASTPSPTSSTSSTTIEQMRIERKNLLGMARLSIKGLIESSLSAGHTLDSDHAPLQQFFIIMEAVLKHGLKAPKLFTGHKLFWGPLEAIEKVRSEAAEITNSVRDLPGIKTHAGRARAWLRLALMQKRLADYFRTMVENRDAMREFYEPESLVLSEEGIVLSGHLVGLNCIDANLCMKGDDLDNQNAVIDYSLYIKEGNRPSIGTEIELAEKEREKEENAKKEKQESPEEIMREMADQKNYLEERNRYLETTLSELQKRAGHTSSSNQLLEAELEAAKLTLATMRGERKKLLDEKETMAASHKKTLEDRQSDLDLERQTLVQSRAGLDEMLNQVKKQLKQEALMRMEVERELELQIGLKQEIEVAMKLLEKDIYDKQDSLVILREQLDNVKGINIDIYKKLQDKTDTIESKTKQITELEEETKRLNAEAGKLKEKIIEANQQLDVALERADRFSQNLDDSEKRRSALETNIQIEREWRIALEHKDEKAIKQITQLETELSMMQLLRQELEQVKNDRDELRSTCEEQESTIHDLADNLGKSKEKFQDLKDVHKSFAEKTWEKDREVKNCAQCDKPFSLARRKHHCRNCGQIYCNTCSDNTMPLASSAKPVRVCDSCHTVLLQRYSAATP